jgi:phosphocarrier protein HPr
MTGETLRQSVAITSPSGFHMRPMAAFAEAASRFPCSVTVLREGKEPINGKSILGLMGLAADQGTELVIEVIGPNASDVMRELVQVLAHNFDEDESA